MSSTYLKCRPNRKDAFTLVKYDKIKSTAELVLRAYFIDPGTSMWSTVVRVVICTAENLIERPSVQQNEQSSLKAVLKSKAMYHSCPYYMKLQSNTQIVEVC